MSTISPASSPPGVIAIPEPADRRPERRRLSRRRRPRRAFGLDVAPLPSPGPVVRDGEIIPASYMNFYIGNAAVVVPQYGAPNDEAAVAAIAGALSRTGRPWACAPTKSSYRGRQLPLHQPAGAEMTQLTVAALQLAFTDDIDENIRNVSALVREAAGKGAKVVLPPELFEGLYFCRTEDEALFANARPLDCASRRACDAQARRGARNPHPDQLLRSGRPASL